MHWLWTDQLIWAAALHTFVLSGRSALVSDITPIYINLSDIALSSVSTPHPAPSTTYHPLITFLSDTSWTSRLTLLPSKDNLSPCPLSSWIIDKISNSIWRYIEHCVLVTLETLDIHYCTQLLCVWLKFHAMTCETWWEISGPWVLAILKWRGHSNWYGDWKGTERFRC